MKYGETYEQTRERYKAPFGREWQLWFAWYPVRVQNGQSIWWEWVAWHYWNGMTYNIPEYREITDEERIRI